MAQPSYRRNSLIFLLLSALVLVLLNVVGRFWFLRFDHTAEKRYTLSETTRNQLKQLDDVVFFKVYLEGEFPAGYQRLHDETRELLDEFRAYGGDNIQYEFVNPSDNPNEKQRYELYTQLTKKGLQPTTLSETAKDEVSKKLIFPGALVSYKGREVPLSLLQVQMGSDQDMVINNSVEGLEFEFTRAIDRLKGETKPRIAFVSGHGELEEIWVRDAVRALSEYYEVERRRMNGTFKSLDGYKAVLIAKPDSLFSDKDKFALDQYIMKGGKVLWLLDGALADMDSLKNKPVTYGVANDVNLSDMLFRYGVRVNPDLVMDLQAAPIPMITGMIGNQPQRALLPWYYTPLVVPTSKHPVVRNLSGIRLEFASSLDTVEVEGVHKEILLSTSTHARKVAVPAKISLELLQRKPDPRMFVQGPIPLAVLLEGTFTSVFKNRLPSSIVNDSAIAYRSEGKTSMVVLGDGDLIKNQISMARQEAYPLGFDRFSGQTYANKTFLLNCMNYLVDGGGLISLRSREVRLRLLDKTMVDANRTYYQWINTALPIGLICLLGLLAYTLRKRRYSHA
jgi:ABC-2 type transport system permease protein